MATEVNTNADNSQTPVMTMLMFLIIVALIIGFMYYFGSAFLRTLPFSGGTPSEGTTSGSGTEQNIQVPEKIDVNIQKETNTGK